MTVLLPPHTPGMRIGLFGGSFNPPHEGHALVARIALARLRLDRVWVLVTPGNPLKEAQGLPSLAARMAATRALSRDPRIVVTGVEAEIGTRYTHDTVAYLHAHCPGVRFVWIMGADNLLQFHRWQKWREIAATTPIAVIDRPGSTVKAMSSKTAQRFAYARIPEDRAALVVDAPPPAFVILHGPRIAQSSTALRERARRSEWLSLLASRP
jgi:nicotinate-nucleotide adenylyltransferase